MSTKLETVAVVREGGRGWHLINKADFDPKKHKAYSPKPAKEAEGDKGKDAK